MKTLLMILLVAALLAVAVIGCGTFNGLGRDVEGLGKGLREVTQPAVDGQTEDRLSSAYGEWQKRSGVVRDDR